MNLLPQAVEFYALTIETDPTVSAWQASFDKGVTWIDAEEVGPVSRWLVAAPGAATNTAVATLAGTVSPLLKAVDNPETLVRHAPKIYVG